MFDPAPIDALLAPWNRSDAPGLVAGIRWRGRTVYRRAFGMASLETGVALSPATRLRIGSTTKHMTALLALLLAEEGLVDLDAPLRACLPQLEGPSGDPSLRLLLQHRGGVRCYLDLGFIAHDQAVAPVGEALALSARQKALNFQPGEAMIYSNGGYHLVSHALAACAGQSFESLLQERLFAPLGMEATLASPGDHELVPGMATLHVPGPGGRWRRGLFPGEDIRGEGSVVSTLDDMLRWVAHLGSRDRFGRAESWRALTERPTYPDGTTGDYALGLTVERYRGTLVHQHAGGVIGGACQMARFPDHDLSIVVMTNGGAAADPVALTWRIADALLADVLEPPVAPLAAGPFSHLAGAYYSPESGMTYGLVEHDGQLKATFNGSRHALPLHDLGDGRGALRLPGMGDVVFDLAAARPAAIPIRFGMQTLDYVPLPQTVVEPDARLLGRYRSHDGACEASVAATPQGVRLVMTDEVGRSASHLTLHTPLFGVATQNPDGTGFPMTLAFSLSPGGAAFRLSTGRTRGLAFEMCD